MEPIVFKCGSYNLNPQPKFNFQLNRVIQWDDGRLETLKRSVRAVPTAIRGSGS